MNAYDRAMQLMEMKASELPKVALEYRNHLARRVGMCIEVCVSAFVTYAHVVEEKTMEGVCDLYIAPPSEIEIVKNLQTEENFRGYPDAKPLPKPPWEQEKIDEALRQQGKT